MSVKTSRYRNISVAMWGDAKFRSLSKMTPSGQSLWIYLLCGPETSALPGVIRVGKGALVDALGWSYEDVNACANEIEDRGMCHFDWDARLAWLPNAVLFNPPVSPNVVIYWRKEFDTLPECFLKDEIGHSFKVFMSDLDRENSGKTQERNSSAWLSAWNGSTKSHAQERVNGRFVKKSNKETNPEQNNPSVKPLSETSPLPLPKPSVKTDKNVEFAENLSKNSTEAFGEVSGKGSGKAFTESVSVSVSVSEAVTDIKDRQSANTKLRTDAVGSGLPSNPPPEQKNEKLESTDGTPALQERMDFFDDSTSFGKIDPVVLEFPLDGKISTFSLRESKITEYEKTFPSLDVRQHLRACRQWNIDNPKRRKTSNGILRHLTEWLNRAQDNAASRGLGRNSEFPTDAVALTMPDDFKQFWAVYPPGRGDQNEALRVWLSLKAESGFRATDVVAGVKSWIVSDKWVNDSGQYIPSPSKFLRERRWLSAPVSRHFEINKTHDPEARFNGMKLRDIQRILAAEAAAAT